MRRLTALLFATVAISLFGCGVAGNGSAPSSPTPPPPLSVRVSVSPSIATLRAGDTYQFMATVTGTTNTAITWSVNDVARGSAAAGTISPSGLYAAPASIPNPNTVMVKATSVADSSASGTSDLTLLNPAPVITAINPSTVAIGPFQISAAGSKFVNGAQVLFGGTPLSTSFVSSNQLTAAGTAQSGGTFPVSVRNPDPGSSSSGSVSLQVGSGGQGSTCSGMSLGQGASLNGFRPFLADNPWNQDISNAPMDPNSDAVLNSIGASIGLHTDFGSGFYQGSSIGIPYVVVGAQQNLVNVNFTAYGDESDPGPMPVPANAPIEGYPTPGNGDRHVLVLDNGNCWLYELFSAYPGNAGTWNAGSAAVWDLLGNEQRPYTWTSADAAGLPIFPGLVRYDEVAAGEILHALRFTLARSRAAFVPPASHWAANSSDPLAAPMGMRLRLRASFDISQFSSSNQVVLKALKQYGMIMADNGASMFISGAPDDRWSNDDLHQLGTVHTSDFEIILMNPLYTASNLPPGAPPSINSFTANPSTTTPGTPVTLSWDATGASYLLVSPQIGAVRGTNVTVTPTQTTTYTLFATNAHARTVATVTVTVR